ncbi:UDP-glucuronosyltransferase 2C1-like [Orbicella faveolata]|uniref:UDP-glucuronosyltransferase 2C1-like n=1 Tax=Orbicella faveolata TaxID=48498 RepID=UPI0009E532BD|nr:UDP-glucuronosyltransferase 2C1-like [Orbicella faveolata]
MFPTMDKVKEQYNIKPDVSTGESLGKAEVVFVQSHFALDFPRPLTPALIVTGPLLPRPAKTLPPELESFMTNSGDDGVVVVAFGSMVSTLPTQTLRMLAIVLGRMKQKVLWKIKAFAFRYSCKVIFHFLSFVLLMTALIVTGPLLPRPAKTLPPELESFMTNSGDDGVVVVAFGSMVSTLPTQTLRMLAIVLGRMKQKVLWKIKESLLSTKLSNIKTVDWIPQNDILGHAKTRLFLPHVGHNSIYEAAYHGVPVVGFPLWSDQPENAGQITRAGMGLCFKQNATRVSRLIKDQRRTPLELTGDWIEFVHRHNGASHLRVQSFNMPWYREYSIDVALFVLFIVTCTLMFLKFCCRCLCKFVVKVMA